MQSKGFHILCSFCILIPVDNNFFSDRQKRRTDPLQPISFIFATQGHSTGICILLSELYAEECDYDAFTLSDTETETDT